MLKKILLHSFAWLAFTVLFCIAVKFNASQNAVIWTVDLTLTILSWAGVFYTVGLVIIPRFRIRKHPFRLTVSLLALFLLYAGYRYVFFYVFMPWLSEEPGLYGTVPFDTWVYRQLWWFSFFMLSGAGYGKAQQAVIIEREKQRIEKDLLKSEISLLRGQFNPHFLHNVLNYMYDKTLGTSEELSTAILLLSDIMRYNISEITKDRVPLDDEIQHLKNFIRLHQLRFDHQLCINFCVNGETKQKGILPLVLVSLVENALKHGQLYDPEHPVQVQLKVTPEAISFTLNNKKNHEHTTSHQTGVNNLKRRLEIGYEGKHDFRIHDTPTHYRSQLSIYE